MTDDRVIEAIHRWDASTLALHELFASGQPITTTAFEPLLAEDRDARKEYAEALIERGWSVPYGLLYDVPKEMWPKGYAE